MVTTAVEAAGICGAVLSFVPPLTAAAACSRFLAIILGVAETLALKTAHWGRNVRDYLQVKVTRFNGGWR